MEHVRVLVFVFRLKTGGLFWHTIFSCRDLLLKFVSLFISPYLTPQLSFWWRNDDFFSQESSPFTQFHYFYCYRTARPFAIFRVLSSENLLHHSDTWALDKVFSSYAPRNKVKVSVTVFFRFTRTLILTLCSIFYQAWLWEF